MKRLVAILLVVLSVFTFTCSAEEIDLTSMTFEELAELRDQIDEQMRANYPEYDYILTEGNYFVGIDMPAGEVMLFRLATSDDISCGVNVRDENEELIYTKNLIREYPRARCTFEEGYEIRLIWDGPIGVQYLQD